MFHGKPTHPRIFEHHKLVLRGLNKMTHSWLGRESGVCLGRVNISKTLSATIKGIKFVKTKKCLPGRVMLREKCREDVCMKTLTPFALF